MDTSPQAIQVRGRERRRFRTVEEKRRIVEEALEPGASVARVARAYRANANLLFGWRRLYRCICRGGSNLQIGKRLVCWPC
jgi:transposase-like protein